MMKPKTIHQNEAIGRALLRLVKLWNSIHTLTRDDMTTSSRKGRVSGYNHITTESGFLCSPHGLTGSPSLEPESNPPSISPSPAWMTTQVKSRWQGRPARAGRPKGLALPSRLLASCSRKNRREDRNPSVEPCAAILQDDTTGHNQSG